MKSLILVSPGELEWRDIPEPEQPVKGALIRPLAVSTCDFDHLLAGGRTNLPMPISIGHECVGEVISVGESVERFKPGDRVIVPFQINCGECSRCRSGHTSSCESVRWLSGYGLGRAAGNWGGAMSDIISVPYADAMLVKLPSGISEHHATCLSCNISDAYRCVAPQLEKNPGAPVFIIGGAFNNIALYSVAIAKILGSSHIDIFGIDESDYHKAESLGGTVLTAIDQVRDNHYPVTVDASQKIERLHVAIAASAPAGALTISTMYTDPLTPLPLMQMFEKCLTLTTGQPDIRSIMENTLPLLRNHQDIFARITDEIIPWKDGTAAFRAGSGKRILVRD